MRIYQAWPTPTPIPTPNATAVMAPILDGIEIDLAEQLVQGYQQANNTGVLEIIFFAILTLLIIGGVWSITRHVQQI